MQQINEADLFEKKNMYRIQYGDVATKRVPKDGFMVITNLDELFIAIQKILVHEAKNDADITVYACLSPINADQELCSNRILFPIMQDMMKKTLHVLCDVATYSHVRALYVDNQNDRVDMRFYLHRNFNIVEANGWLSLHSLDDGEELCR